MTQLITNIQEHPSSHMHKYCSLTAFNIHYIRIPKYTLLPIMIISHRSIIFEQKCRQVVSLSVDELSQKMCRRIVLSTSCLDSYRNIHSIQDCFILQEDLTSLGQWEADWQMKFKVAKCHSMRVTRHQHHKQILFDYSLHN